MMENGKVKPWIEHSREEMFRKYGRGIDKVVYEVPGGETAEYYVKNERPAAGVLALTKNQEVILLKQFRPGPAKMKLELPGGFIEPGEDASVAIARELLEETGYAGDITLVSRFDDDAYSTMERFAFVATDCKKVTGQELDDNEYAELMLVSPGEFKQLIIDGASTDPEIGLLGLHHLGLL